MEELYKIMVEYRETIKLFHFQCKRFSQHKASDRLIEEFDKLFDKFFELYQGKLGRLQIKNINLTIKSNTKEQTQDNTLFLIDILHKLTLNNDLANIRDEIIGELHQYLYLLSFI